MACAWWDDDYKHVVRSSFGDQKGKSHEKKDKSQNNEDHNKGKSHEKGKNNHEGKRKEQKLPEKSYGHGYDRGYVNGYMKGYEDGYESGYEQGCENTRNTKFGDGYNGKKREYYGYHTIGYIECHRGYELDNTSKSKKKAYGYNDSGSEKKAYGYNDDVAGYARDSFQSYGGWNNNDYDSDY